ncbi:hypothetical protein EDD85DRAFT_932781 [Armillaria nabsnona]|nr:hypothetical protein EDD85DRAFT_932781 [Armillaria nabsnona]
MGNSPSTPEISFPSVVHGDLPPPVKRSWFDRSSDMSNGARCTNIQYEILLGTALFVLIILILHRWIRKGWSIHAPKVADGLESQGTPTEIPK